MKQKTKIITFSILAILLIIGAIAGFKFLEIQKVKNFNKAYNDLNDKYKQALFQTGQNNSESLSFYQEYESGFTLFKDKYTTSPVTPFDKDNLFNTDLNEISTWNQKALYQINNKEFKEAHLTLEKIRPIWQEIFKRNNFNLFGLYMIDFHDSMEVSTEAETTQEILDNCADLNEKWNQVNANLPEVQTDEFKTLLKIEDTNVKEICSITKITELEQIKKLQGDIKSDFVKLYLKYG